MQVQLVEMKSLLAMKQNGQEEEFEKQLKDRGIKDLAECDEIVDDLEIKLKLKERKEKTDSEKYDLLDIADDDLTEEQIKKKRIQKMQKAQAVNREERKKQQEKE